jgi:hypothetical protein
MAKLTPEEEKKKRELFEGMSPKAQQRILKRGYDNWDPFMMPKEPLAYKLKQEAKGEQVRVDSGHELYERFFAERRITSYSAEYVKGVLEISQGLYRGIDRYQGMYDFSCWYEVWRKRQGQDEGDSDSPRGSG